jgi:hypothetical protein
LKGVRPKLRYSNENENVIASASEAISASPGGD